ncbi:MAG: NAD(P)-binding protein [Gammaproteobacteria bacterium]
MAAAPSGRTSTKFYEAVVIGAGVSGRYALHKLREMGLSARVFEAGSAVGGTWYWNRYPGARFDSESYSYQYSFSRELIEEWDWSEEFAAQPGIERYLNHVADKFDRRRDIEFDARVNAVVFDEDERLWDIKTEDGRHARARYVHAAAQCADRRGASARAQAARRRDLCPVRRNLRRLHPQGGRARRRSTVARRALAALRNAVPAGWFCTVARQLRRRVHQSGHCHGSQRIPRTEDPRACE